MMEKTYLFFVGACLIGLSLSVSEEDEFARFIEQYGKVYERGSTEYETRFNNFKESLKRHKKLNSQSRNQHDAKFGVTKFSDMSPEEFAETVLMGHHPQAIGSMHAKFNFSSLQLPGLLEIPDPYDMRHHGWPVITPVKNQKECGGCWAFSITENLETQYALKNKKLYELSEQELIDCTEGGAGCRGGNICSTAAWLNKTHLKVTTEKEYPFKDDTGICKISPHGGKVGITDYSCDRFVGNETAMVHLIANHGPLAVAVDATSWQDYLGGIIQHHCSPDDNHAVQIIGYDRTGPVPFYIIRNSWGEDWGIHGYLHIKIGDNLCGIANEVVTVTV